MRYDDGNDDDDDDDAVGNMNYYLLFKTQITNVRTLNAIRTGIL